MSDVLSRPPADVEATQDEPSPYGLFYALGVVAQICLWALAFLGILVALSVGAHITEFRYVGF